MAVIPHDGSDYSAEHGGAINIAPRLSAARAFYETHSDSYDFLFVFPTFAADLGQDVGGLHWSVRQDVSGIGLPSLDIGTQFGSSARLKGYIDVGALIPGAATPDIAAAANVLAHETLHQFAAHVQFKRAGQLRGDLLGQRASHWSFFVDSEASVEYGSDWVDNGNGTFTAHQSRRRYSSLDLYLMGFLAASEVAPITLLTPGPQVTQVATDTPPPDGTTITATAETVSIDEIVAANGPRVPGSSAAPHVFRAAFLVLVPPGQQPTPAQTGFVEALRSQWANQFFFLTRGRGVMDTDLVEVPPEPVSSNPSVIKGLDYLLMRQAPTGLWADQLPTGIRDTQSALEALALFASDPRVPASMASGAGALSFSAVDGTDSASRRALGLLAARQSAGSVAAALAGMADPAGLNSDHGYGYARGYASSVIDSALAATALLVSGSDPQSLAALTEYLLASKNQDGGWPYARGGPSRIEPTAQVLDYLSRLPRSASISTASDAGLGFLTGRKQPDGSYRDDRPSPGATALSVLSFAAWQRLTAQDASSAGASLLASQRPDGSWGGTSHQTALVLKALRTTLSPNLAVAVADVSLPAVSATEGEQVVATATVRNSGFADASGVQVQAFDSSGIPFGPAVTLAAIPAGGTATASLSLDTTAHGGSSSLFVVVDPAGLVDEAREDDNRVSLALQVNEPPEEPDLFVAVGSIATVPAQIDRFPQTLTVTARLGNLGLTDVFGARVTVIVGGVAGTPSLIGLLGQSSVPVTLYASVSAATGAVPVTVLIEPGAGIVEARTDNNSASTSVPLVPTVDLVVGNLVLSPSPVDQGRDVDIAFEVANHGTTDASGVSARVTVADQTGAVVANLLPVGADVAVGSVASRHVVWRANVAGTVSIEVKATSPQELTPADNTATATLTVVPSTLPNLLAPAAGLVFTPDPPLEGGASSVTARLSNEGAGAAGAFAVEVFLGDPAAGGTLLSRSTLPGLAAGATASVSAAFTPSDANPLLVYLEVDSDGQVAEFDEADNVTVRTVTPSRLPDLVVQSGDILPDNPFPQAGATVLVRVSVLNAGGQGSPATSVDLYGGAPEAGGALIGTQALTAIGGGGRGEVSFSWATGSSLGPQTLVAVVNRSNVAFESKFDNNRAERQVIVQDANLALSNPYFSPNGDGVKDSTEVFYRLQQAAPVQVSVVDKEGITVRSLSGTSSTSGSLGWDGRDDQGKVARDGAYQLVVNEGAGSTQTLLGTLVATLDTNHSPLQQAAGTPLLAVEDLEANVTAYFTGRVSVVAATPTDQGVIFFADQRFGGQPTECGFYLQPIGGGEPTRLTPTALGCSMAETGWGLAVSPAGDDIAFFGYAPCDYTTCLGLKAFSISQQSVRPLVSPVANDSVVIAQDSSAQYSPDGSVLLFLTTDYSIWEDRLEVVDASGANRRVLATTSAMQVREYGFSPNGASVSYLTADGALAVVSLQGGPARTLFSSSGAYLDPSADKRHVWLPGGSELALTLGDGQPVLGIDATTGASRILLNEPQMALAVSPFGDAMALASKPPDVWDPECEGDGCFIPGTDPWQVRYTSPIGAATKVLHAPPGLGGVSDLQWSPGGTYVFGHLNDPVSGDSYKAITSLANLTNRFMASRAPGASSISFRGTEADVNFEKYELSVRPIPSTVTVRSRLS